jgi:signal transduction histidine kinase
MSRWKVHSFRAIVVLDCLVYLFCLVGLWQVAGKANLPFSLLQTSDSTFSVAAISGPLGQCGIHPGDVVATINGITASSNEDVEFILDGKRIGESILIGIKRGDEAVLLPVKLVNNYSWFYVAVAWFVGTLFFLSGLVVIIRKRKDLAAIIYHFGSMAVAVIVMSTWGCYVIRPIGVGQAVRIMFSMAYVFLPVMLLQFSLAFPSRKVTVLSKFVAPLYTVSAILSIFMAATFLKATLPFSLKWFHTFMIFFNVTRWIYPFCVVAATVEFINSYRTAREEMERRQIRWVALGLVTSSLGFVLLWQIPQLLTSHGLVKEEFVVLLSSTTPIAFSIAIVRYHVMDIDYIFNRSTVYAIVLGTVLCIYALLVGAVAIAVQRFTVSISIFASAFAAVIVALLFEPIRSRTQTFVDRTFFRVKYNMRNVERNFREEAKKCTDVTSLAKRLVDVVMDAIPVDRIGFFLLEQQGDGLQLTAHRNFEVLSNQSVEFQPIILKSLLDVPFALEEKVEPAVKFEPADREFFQKWGMAIVFVVKPESGGAFGFLVLGEKKSRARFSIEDVDLLQSLARDTGEAQERIVLQSRLLFEQEETKRLEELNKMKTYFVASVSHDLKTPLTNIRMFTEMLKSEKVMKEKKAGKYLDIIEGESKRLTRLIDNVLNVAKIERGNLRYSFATISLNETVSETLKAAKYELQKAKCTVRLKLARGKLPIEASHDAVVEALSNLLSNAVQYSSRKKLISVETYTRDKYACVSVKDSGIGIPSEEVPHLFEPFYRGRFSSDLRPGGTGLGLSVVKNIMDAHRGKIEIESTPNVGTVITLLFPEQEIL